MGANGDVDYYEVLQVSESAEPETVNRVYRLLAQRYHPDNQESGNEARFREITEAYHILSSPEKRAQYDATYQQRRKDRWRLVSAGPQSENDFEMEQVARLTVLEALYTKRRVEPQNPGIYLLELEKMLGRPREHLEFTIWFLNQKKLINTDDARMYLTADGAEYLEETYRSNLQQRKRLQSSND
ncbi:MAG TPA: DnaJ domain-containing protein [Pyrinomonadaceae bacterium]|nr:DnaJ domain-containing protein [Pyrinomonadaceae bacterium]